MFKKTAAAAAVSLCCALGGAGSASADTFLFNPLGGGLIGAYTVDKLDWIPGNTLAIDGSDLTVGQQVQDYFQANLGTAILGSANQWSNGSGAFFTVVAGFQERVIATNLVYDGNTLLGGSATFSNPLGTPDSFFRICLQTATGNDLTGGGFGCNDSNAVLTGTFNSFVGLPNVTTQFFLGLDDTGNPIPLPILDQSGDGDQWAGQLTAVVTGSANIKINVVSVNNNYFPNLFPAAQIVTSVTNTSLIDPFNQQNPSYCFSADGKVSSISGNSTCTAGTIQAFGTLGGTNGLPFQADGPYNFIFQADANTTVTGARSVPEPATLGLLGLALGAVAVATRRRAKGGQRV
jgi:hypothetical protein